MLYTYRKIKAAFIEGMNCYELEAKCTWNVLSITYSLEELSQKN